MGFKLMTFEELTSIELYKILQARTDIFVVEQNCAYPEVDGKDLLSYHLFKEINGEIVAYLRILPPGVSYEQASIGRVIVKKEYRGQKLAQQMLGKAIEFIIEEMKETKIKIQAQEYLLAFYSSFGFQPISESYLEDGIPHVDMLLVRE